MPKFNGAVFVKFLNGCTPDEIVTHVRSLNLGAGRGLTAKFTIRAVSSQQSPMTMDEAATTEILKREIERWYAGKKDYLYFSNWLVDDKLEIRETWEFEFFSSPVIHFKSTLSFSETTVRCAKPFLWGIKLISDVPTTGKTLLEDLVVANKADFYFAPERAMLKGKRFALYYDYKFKNNKTVRGILRRGKCDKSDLSIVFRMIKEILQQNVVEIRMDNDECQRFTKQCDNEMIQTSAKVAFEKALHGIGLTLQQWIAP